MCHLLLLLPVAALPVFWLWPPPVAVPLYTAAIVPTAVVYLLAARTMRLPRLNGTDGIVGTMGRVVGVDGYSITLQVGGEYWAADADSADFAIGDRALVTGIDRLRLKVCREDGDPALVRTVTNRRGDRPAKP